VVCKACRHQAHADLEKLVDEGRGDVPLIHLRYRWANAAARQSRSDQRAARGVGLRPASGRRMIIPDKVLRGF